ncbi:MAG: Rab family GTPase [Promethearchaeota archaeon]
MRRLKKKRFKEKYIPNKIQRYKVKERVSFFNSKNLIFESECPVYIFKICLIGSPAVGKTCIARRLCFDTFDFNTQLTIGIDFYTYDIPIIVKGEKTFVRLTVWEFGGQEQFKKLFRYYIDGADGIFLVFDLANLKTLTKLDWWYHRLIEHNMLDRPKTLIGAKIDLVDEKSELFRNDEAIILDFIKDHGKLNFIKTSAKENINIQNLFRKLLKEVLELHDLEYDRIL